jgi:hypothetical protein
VIGPQREVLAADRRFMSRTGVEAFDKLAKDSPAEFQAFLERVEKNGWIVKETDKINNSPALFFPRKARFYYDPERMTILDMQHEAKHLELFEQRGSWKHGGGLGWRDEIEAYTMEYELGKQHEFSKEYTQYLDTQIGYYKALVSPDGPGLRPSTMPDPFFKRMPGK